MWVSKPQGGVESRVRCNGCLRTPPGSEDSNGKLDVPCAVGSPGWSFNCGARADVVRRSEVHDHFRMMRDECRIMKETNLATVSLRDCFILPDSSLILF